MEPFNSFKLIIDFFSFRKHMTYPATSLLRNMQRCLPQYSRLNNVLVFHSFKATVFVGLFQSLWERFRVRCR